MATGLTPERLQNRLLSFATAVGQGVRGMLRDMVGLHIGRQLLRSGTAPAANHAEGRSAESRRDFVHKIQICLRELREVSVWLQLASRMGSRYGIDVDVVRECNELIAIFVKSVNTARSSRSSA